jgi:kynurenine formamidase
MSAKGAKVYELSYERSATMPLSPFAGAYSPKFLPSIGLENTIQFYNMETLNPGVNDGNHGTQMDALGHFAYLAEPWDGQGQPDFSKATYFGGFRGLDVKPTPNSPLQFLGMESVPPLVTTAVLIDVRKYVYKGKAMSAGEFVSVEDIKTSIEQSGLKNRGILAGDIVLINTGWSDNYQDPDETKMYYSSAPGLSYAAAEYLAEQKVVGVGLDTPFVDAVPSPNALIVEPDPSAPKSLGFAVHHFFLTQAGVHTLENFRLKELVEDSVELSCVMVLPLLSRGSAASPIRPVAIGVPAG